MLKRLLIITCFLLTGVFCRSQNTRQDTIPAPVDDMLVMDTTLDYDALLSEFDLFLDSILAPRSYFMINLAVSQSYYNFTSKNNTRASVERKIIWSPSLGYYGKSGLGITATGYGINENGNFNLYQYSITPSYDYIKNRDLVTGISYTHYFTKGSLNFYTSPLQNDIYGYFQWRKSWLQPGITAGYGWGSRKQYQRIERQYKETVESQWSNTRDSIRISAAAITTITNTIIRQNKESIVDFSTAASLRHDFYWLDVLSNNDYIRFSPQVSLSGGTQRFGFNQATNTSTYVNDRLTVDYSTRRSINLEQKFKILSMSLYLRGDYSVGKFYIQPQVLFDYYFPAVTRNLSTFFSVNTGFIF